MFRPAGRRVRRIDDPQISAYTTKVRRVPIRVVFAEDNYLVREVTSTLLAEVEEIDPVGVVAESTAMLRSVAELSPDAVLTDIRMPPSFTSEGIDAAKRIRAEYPSVGVVVLSQYASDDLALSCCRTASPDWNISSRSGFHRWTSWFARCRRSAGAVPLWIRRSLRG